MPDRPRLFSVEVRSAAGVFVFDTMAVSEEKAISNACYQYAKACGMGIALIRSQVKQQKVLVKILQQAKASSVVTVTADVKLRESPKEYAQRIVKMGIKLLGAGTDAVVFQHPDKPHIAVKLVDAKSWHMKWIRWSQKNQSNKFVPRVHALYEVTMKGGKNYGLLFTDFLTRCSYEKYKKIDEDLHGALIQMESQHCYEFRERAQLWLSHLKPVLPADLVSIMEVSFKHGHVDMNVHNVGLLGSQLVLSDPWGPLKFIR